MRYVRIFAALVLASPAVVLAATEWKFGFGAAAAAAGYQPVSMDQRFSRESGYGFEPGAELELAGGRSVTSTSPFSFSLAVPEGNYRVTVTLGHPTSRAVTTVKAESRRLMLERVQTKAGEFVTRTFVVNVRGPKLADGQEVLLDSRERDPAAGYVARHWDEKLTITFTDEQPSVATMVVERVTGLPTLFLTGDSTVTDQQQGPNSSWGQLVTRWFKPEIAVSNHAESGETLKGFLKERRWQKVLEMVKPGDWVLIEFGTNDSKSSGPQNIYPGQDFSETYAPAETTYKELLRRFVADVRARRAHPIIASSSARRGEVSEPTSLAPWAEAAMAVAQELEVPAIDLNAMGVELNRALGDEAEQQFADRTHHTEYGAYLQAKSIVLGLKQAGVPLGKYVVDEFAFDPAKPKPTPAEFDLPPDRRR